ncbi:hypothetical protein AB0C29_49090, partial [Actinoplanes sp. NPDC048791]|uniref:hypothetical protein n=1 Tax=Actinoplanes sp. NPDC048791 TaxID=3154623 RepID=UPI0033F38EC3
GFGLACCVGLACGVRLLRRGPPGCLFRPVLIRRIAVPRLRGHAHRPHRKHGLRLSRTTVPRLTGPRLNAGIGEITLGSLPRTVRLARPLSGHLDRPVHGRLLRAAVLPGYVGGRGRARPDHADRRHLRLRADERQFTGDRAIDAVPGRKNLALERGRYARNGPDLGGNVVRGDPGLR